MGKNKVLYAGNRPSILSMLMKRNDINLVKAIVPRGIDCRDMHIQTSMFNGKDALIEDINGISYDFFISAGCPYIIDLDKITNTQATYINCHPSPLPLGKGRHPLNECFLSGNNVAGVSVHYLTKEVDAGDIIDQVIFPLSDDIDVSLLYGFIFDLESELLSKSLDSLLSGKPIKDIIKQKGSNKTYKRPRNTVCESASLSSCKDFVNKTRAFSDHNHGVLLKTNNYNFLTFHCQIIQNKFLLERYNLSPIGETIFYNQDVALVRFKDGLIRLNRFQILSANTT